MSVPALLDLARAENVAKAREVALGKLRPALARYPERGRLFNRSEGVRAGRSDPLQRSAAQQNQVPCAWLTAGLSRVDGWSVGVDRYVAVFVSDGALHFWWRHL